MLKGMISIAATGLSRKGRKRKIMVNDVSRAYFYAPNQETMFVDICEEDKEDGDEEMCGELLVSMYGTRPAATNWQKCYTELLVNNGFSRNRASTCIFHHVEKDIKLKVHGDDFVSTADEDDLKWLQGIFESKFEISTTTIGHDEGDKKEVKVLNRIISVKDNGYTYEADARHAELIIKGLDLENAKGVTTPYQEENFESEELLDHEKFKRYQSICARTNYLSTDRHDIMYATKECCRAMSKPTVRDWSRLKRIGRYLIDHKRLVYHYDFQDDVNRFDVYSDASWASNKVDRKSTSGGIIMHGIHHIKAWSKTQSVVALSSAESELYGIVKASAEILGLKSLFLDIGLKFSSIIYSDASAALGIIQRQGLGRTRHIDCGYLFVQGLNAEKVIRYAKVPGEENPADMCTKGLKDELIKKHTWTSNGVFTAGRPELCARI